MIGGILFRSPGAILTAIVIAQFFCTSLWFAGNGVLQDLIDTYDLHASVLGHLTTAIQSGFIAGTLVFAVYTFADRYSPSQVFLWCAIAGAVANAGMIAAGNTFYSLMSLRFVTGFFLAGVYPVGMKIAADYFDRDLGKALGLLVGALVFGTALPHLVRYLGAGMDWRMVVLCISLLAVAGGMLIGLFIKDGPYRSRSQIIDPGAMIAVFRPRNFRRPAFGYFGHMWEVYTFWAFAPVMLAYFREYHTTCDFDISLWSFVVIAAGGVGCILNGYWSRRAGAARAAVVALVVSGLCCALSPFVYFLEQNVVFLMFMVIWGVAVVADSPMFSTLVAQEAPPQSKGTALTIVICIGFAITIGSIQLVNWLVEYIPVPYVFLWILPGPVLGLLAMANRYRNENRWHLHHK